MNLPMDLPTLKPERLYQRISSLMVQKWEYKVDNFHWDISTLDAQGAQGWELCGMSPIPDNQGGGQTVAFKPPVR